MRLKAGASFAAILLPLVLATSAVAARPTGSLSLGVTKHEIKDWLRARAKTEPREGRASLVDVRTISCRRHSRTRVECDGVTYWRSPRRTETHYVCLKPRVSVRLEGGHRSVRQVGVQETRCGPNVRVDEELVGFH
jgi:hypothetical protein